MSYYVLKTAKLFCLFCCFSPYYHVVGDRNISCIEIKLTELVCQKLNCCPQVLLHVLFEHAAGYALFAVKEAEEIGMLLPQVGFVADGLFLPLAETWV